MKPEEAAQRLRSYADCQITKPACGDLPSNIYIVLTALELAKERFKARKHELEEKDAEIAWLRLGLEQIVRYAEHWAEASNDDRLAIDDQRRVGVLAIANKTLEKMP